MAEVFAETLPKINLLGPFKHVIKISGVDCSSLANFQKKRVSKICSVFQVLLVLLIVALLIFRMIMYLTIQSVAMSLQWAEANLLTFTSLHAIACALCMAAWTKSKFIKKHLNTLEEVRMLRLNANETLDNYTKYRISCCVLPIFYFGVAMTHSIYCAVQKRMTIEEQNQHPVFYIIMPILTIISCLVVSITLIVYNLITLSLNRELEYFNEELGKAAQANKLSDINTVTAFSNRQTAILNMVNQANQSLGYLTKVSPLFLFYAEINAVYMCGFFMQIPVLSAVIFVFYMNVVFEFVRTTLSPAGKVQDNIHAIGKTLMLNKPFESICDPNVHETYRRMIDRSCTLDIRMYFLNGFAIDSSFFNIAMLLVPNIAVIMMVVKQILEVNGLIL